MQRSLALTAVVLALLLSGCTGGGTPAENTTRPVVVPPMLEGWVQDAQGPIQDATVSVPSENVTASVGPDGRYAFQVLPVDVPLVVVAEAPGYKTLSKSTTLLPHSLSRLNFTLEAVPVKTPRVDVQIYKGLLACQIGVAAMEDEQHVECGANDPNNKPRIPFAVGPDTVGIVLELVWDPATPLARDLSLLVETVGYGDYDEVLSQVIGESVLRTQVNALQASKFYTGQGGLVRATVAAGTEPEEDEASVGVSVPLQQEFELYVSTFYVAPPLPTYTALTA
jgi:hypothetical protein